MTAPIINQPQVAILSTDGIGDGRSPSTRLARGDRCATGCNLVQSFEYRAIRGVVFAPRTRRLHQIANRSHTISSSQLVDATGRPEYHRWTKSPP